MNGAPLGLLPDLDNNVAEKVRLQQRLSFAAGSERNDGLGSLGEMMYGKLYDFACVWNKRNTSQRRKTLVVGF